MLGRLKTTALRFWDIIIVIICHLCLSLLIESGHIYSCSHMCINTHTNTHKQTHVCTRELSHKLEPKGMEELIEESSLIWRKDISLASEELAILIFFICIYLFFGVVMNWDDKAIYQGVCLLLFLLS